MDFFNYPKLYSTTLVSTLPTIEETNQYVHKFAMNFSINVVTLFADIVHFAERPYRKTDTIPYC